VILVLLVKLEVQALRELLDQQVLKASKVRLDQLVPRERQVLKDLLVQQAQLERQAKLVQQDCRVKLDRLEPKV
jgi:hypothetical protein